MSEVCFLSINANDLADILFYSWGANSEILNNLSVIRNFMVPTAKAWFKDNCDSHVLPMSQKVSGISVMTKREAPYD